MTACKGSITAKKIATEVVAQNLGTSVRIISGVNTFIRWVGKVEHGEEQLLLIRSNAAASAKLEKCIKRLHPHELPEITAVPISTGLTDT